MSGIIFSAVIQDTPSWELVRKGLKTQTFRLNGNRFEVGKTYAYQPGRGKKAIGRVLIKGWRYTTPSRLTNEDILAEGFTGPEAAITKRHDFYDCLAKLLHVPRSDVWGTPGYSVCFALVKEKT